MENIDGKIDKKGGRNKEGGNRLNGNEFGNNGGVDGGKVVWNEL